MGPISVGPKFAVKIKQSKFHMAGDDINLSTIYSSTVHKDNLSGTFLEYFHLLLLYTSSPLHLPDAFSH